MVKIISDSTCDLSAELIARYDIDVIPLHIVLGEGRDIVVDYFESLFRFLARGTVAEDAEIVLHPTPYMARCNACGGEFHLIPIDKRTWTCPECGAFRDYQLTSGMEFYISKIEAARQTEP
jgi:hydrogenase nickel incorporation protein HypA/HybF